ncbi:CUB domain-containing protein 2, partial [Chaetura pelagica]
SLGKGTSRLPLCSPGIKCGGVLSAPSGNFSSPNFPGPYPYETECTWLIVVAEGSSVLLSFSHFLLEYHAACAYDYLQVYNGATQDRGNLLGTFCPFLLRCRGLGEVGQWEGCGDGPPRWGCGGLSPTAAGGGCLSLEQETSFSLAHAIPCGYWFSLPAFVGLWPPWVLPFPQTDECPSAEHWLGSSECQEVFTTIRGNFTSPRYPSFYPNNLKCQWSIQLPLGYRVKVFFLDMELEGRNSLTGSCDYDHLAAFDGGNENGSLLGRWCGWESPAPITSHHNQLLLVLHTDRNTAKRGFSIAYMGGE